MIQYKVNKNLTQKIRYNKVMKAQICMNKLCKILKIQKKIKV